MMQTVTVRGRITVNNSDEMRRKAPRCAGFETGSSNCRFVRSHLHRYFGSGNATGSRSNCAWAGYAIRSGGP